LRIFFDTNVLISAFISHGTCNEVFNHCLTKHTIYISRWVLREFQEKLLNKFGFSKSEVNQAGNFLKRNSAIITHAPLSSRVCCDPDDDNILAAISTENVNCLVTGDDDLLKLKKFQKIPIVKPSDFWKFEENQK